MVRKIALSLNNVTLTLKLLRVNRLKAAFIITALSLLVAVTIKCNFFLYRGEPEAEDDVPCWSPDGTTIAFYRTYKMPVLSDKEVKKWKEKWKKGIYFINPNGKNCRLFLEGGDTPDWSPDGKWIAISFNAQIYKIRKNGDSLTQLTSTARNFFPRWSPDGRRIVWSVSGGEHEVGNWIMNSDGSNKRRLPHMIGPRYSPDSRKFVFSANVGCSANSSVQIFIADTNGQNRQQLTAFGLFNEDPVFSPDGEKIAFSSHDSIDPEIWVMNSDGTNLQRLTTDGGKHPKWSPAGTKIIYTSYRYQAKFPDLDTLIEFPVGEEFKRLWIMNPDGTGKRQLTK